MTERVARLEPNVNGTTFFYAEPNPALTEILIGPALQGITAEYTARVLAGFLALIENRPRVRDKHPGLMGSMTRAEVFIGGNHGDRWVGQIVNEVEYASADEFGRDAYAPYEGHHDLRNALYAELPPL